MKKKVTKKRTSKKMAKVSLSARTKVHNPSNVEQRPMPNPRSHDSQVYEARVFEAEVLQGLVPFALKELERVQGVQILTFTGSSIHFKFSGKTEVLQRLKRIVAVYRQESFEVPRPKAFLGDQHFKRLTQTAQAIVQASAEPFTGFRIEAAGKTSSVFQRLAEALAKELKLPFDSEKGDLMFRIKPSQKGWDVLIRLSARPLSARAWRNCNMSGGLNATVAVCMNDLAKLRPNERYLNAMCGSGTLIIEQGLLSKDQDLFATDISEKALKCAHANIEAAQLKRLHLKQADVTQLDSNNNFDVITADLPWGDAVGSHHNNAELYPAFLNEMARVSTHKARLVILTHELKLFESIIKDDKHWFVKESFQVAHSGHHPKIYLLMKK